MIEAGGGSIRHVPESFFMVRPLFLDSETATPRHRWRRLVSHALLLVSALIVGGGWLFVAVMNHRLNAVLAETDRLDPGWRLEDLDAKRPVIPDEENSALTVAAAVRKMPPRWPEWDYPLPQLERLPLPAGADLPPEPPGEGMLGAADVADPAEEARGQFYTRLCALQPPVRLTTEQADGVRAERIRAADAVALARSLVHQPRGRHPDSRSKDRSKTASLIFQDTRQAARLLQFDALLRAADGDLESALASCVAMLNAAASLHDEPALNHQQNVIAVRALAVAQIERVLAQGEPPVAPLAALQARLAEEAERPVNLVGTRGERADMDRLMEAIQNGDMTLSEAHRLKGRGGKGRAIDDPFLLYVPGAVAASRAAMLRRMNEAIAIMKSPTEQQESLLQKWEADAMNESVLVRELCPVLIKVFAAGWRSQAQFRCAAVALAVERYRRKHGRWPEALSDLAPAFLKAVPTDPFDGQPLRYRKDKEGVVVYSVGQDRKDDGGAFDTLNSDRLGTDLGFRLWESDRRGRLRP